MARNAHRTLRICLAAVTTLLLFAESSFAAQTYKVNKGDTLYSIAKKFGTSVSALQRVNHLSSSRSLRTGQVLTIPPKLGVAEPAPVTYGIAKEDDVEVLSDDGKVITGLRKNHKFVVLERDGDRFHVGLSDGRKGWVRADAVTLDDTRKPVSSGDDTWSPRRDVVRTALAYRGARYRRGGESSLGFDCSGFVKYVYSVHGVRLPHSSRSLFSCGTPVSKSDLQPGDLVFFAGTYRRGISHVGLYIGDGKFIHASTSRGGVRVDELSAPYYQRHYAGARRLKS